MAGRLGVAFGFAGLAAGFFVWALVLTMAGLSGVGVGVGVGTICFCWSCACCGFATEFNATEVVFSVTEIVTGCADGAGLGIAWACDNSARSPTWIPTDVVAANQIFFFCICEILLELC